MAIFLLMSAVSAILIALSFPPFHLGFLAWFGLAPFLFALRQRGSLAAGGLGFLFGCLFSAGVFRWFGNMDSLNLPDILVGHFIFGLYIFIFAFLYRVAAEKLGRWIIFVAPALWVAVEFLRSNLFFLSWPWGLLGHSQYRCLHVIQIADLCGVYGISFALVMVNQALSELPELIGKFRGRVSGKSGLAPPAAGTAAAHWIFALMAVSVVFLYGFYRLSAHKQSGHIRVAIIQANAVVRENMPPREQEEHLDKYRALTEEAAKQKPDLIVWPSSSLPAPLRLSLMVNWRVSWLARETRCYLLVGGAGYEKMRTNAARHVPYANCEYLFSPAGRIVGQYRKVQLLPFNEYLPLEGRIKWPEWITTLKESFLPGDTLTLFQVSGARFGTPICWENMLPDFYRRFVLKGANLMVSVANEAFFGRSAAPYQSLAMNVFRAVENRVSVVRATTTGISAFIGPTGKIAEIVKDGDEKDLFVSGFLVRNVSLSNRKTFYTLHGDLFAYLAIAVSILSFVGTMASSYSKRWFPAVTET